MFALKNPNRAPQEKYQQATVIETIAETEAEKGSKMPMAFFNIETVHGMEHICEVYETVTDTWIGAD